jgi:hypothetical protein
MTNKRADNGKSKNKGRGRGKCKSRVVGMLDKRSGMVSEEWRWCGAMKAFGGE